MAHIEAPHERVVDATTRGIDDLDVVTWIGITGAACLARTALQHPFVLACARRQACSKLEKMSSWELLATMRRESGGSWRAMYRGFPAIAIGMTASEVLYMWEYEWLRNPRGSSPLVPIAPRVCADDDAKPAATVPSTHFLDGSAGFAADFTTTIVQVPFFFIANRQMCAGIGAATGSTYKGAWATLTSATKASPLGWRGMFTGLSASLLLSTHSAFWWAGYEDFKARLYPALRPSLEDVAASYPQLPAPLVSTADNVPINTFAAVAAGTGFAILWNPVLVLRTRMQLLASETSAPRLRDVARHIWKHEGARGFTKGTCMSIVANAVDSVVFCTFYEVGKQLAQRQPAATSTTNAA
jgi:hypothetical protein